MFLKIYNKPAEYAQPTILVVSLQCRICGEYKIAQQMKTTMQDESTFVVEYKVVLERQIYDITKDSYYNDEEIIHVTPDLNESFIFFGKKYKELKDEFHGLSWRTIMDKIICDKITDSEPNYLENYYYEKFTEYFGKYLNSEVIVYLDEDEENIAFFVDKDTIAISREFMNNIKIDTDSFSEYFYLYANYINKKVAEIRQLSSKGWVNFVYYPSYGSLQTDLNQGVYLNYERVICRD